jgi:hypothetical protein
LAGCCECGDEPSGSGATELVKSVGIKINSCSLIKLSASMSIQDSALSSLYSTLTCVQVKLGGCNVHSGILHTKLDSAQEIQLPTAGN